MWFPDEVFSSSFTSGSRIVMWSLRVENANGGNPGSFGDVSERGGKEEG
jgi:hypothetical protein